MKQLVPNWIRRHPIAPPHILADLGVLTLSLFVSLYLRLGAEEYFEHFFAACFYLPFILLVRCACLYGFGVYSAMWRYVSTSDALRIIKAVGISLLIIVGCTFFVPDSIARLPRAVYLIDCLLSMLLLMGSRFYRRLQIENRAVQQLREGRRTIIYGAGNNGRLMAQRFRSDAGLDANLLGFIDDDPAKLGLTVGGTPVLGTLKELESLVQDLKVTQLIIALPNLPGDLLREVLIVARKFNIRPRITTNLSQHRDGTNVEIYRDIELSDLLNRSKRDVDLRSVREMIRGKRILVTGAGGSIGSELCRQIYSHDPGRLLLLDHSEYNLYEIDKELRSSNNTERVLPLLVDLKDEASLRHAVKEYAPEIVFHAAAYKHVHLVESNPYPSILNNVQGTKVLLDVCKQCNVETFVMVSTDKAVNPVGVMGATKRVCELLVTMTAIETKRRYTSVRFGNVLGSSGSLIPLLQKQIQDGGPVTITHKDMTRFFMLIPEAVSLVLKAATIAAPGDINVLKMGEPVRILEIARNLLAMMGKTEADVPILFTGLRPGEKMFEELYIRGDELKTEDPDILTIPNGDAAILNLTTEQTRIQGLVSSMVTSAIEAKKSAIYDLNELVRSTALPRADGADHQSLDILSAPSVGGSQGQPGAGNGQSSGSISTIKSTVPGRPGSSHNH